MVEKNNDIVIDGVCYELSPADWKLQQQILSRARVVNVDAVVERLVGHKNVVYYNCETNAWNTNRYNDDLIMHQDINTRRVKEFKSAMDKEPKFSQQYAFTAPVIMTIDKDVFPGCGKPINNPKYSKKGTAVVGNIIVKNKATGKYELYCKSWVGVDTFTLQCLVVSSGISRFGDYSAFPDYRAALIAAHTR